MIGVFITSSDILSVLNGGIVREGGGGWVSYTIWNVLIETDSVVAGSQ